ncbi:MAG: PEGA domain-containing protein [Deltaproteobacteria bacterium]|nr:PEGA domain-containing protein [Deltaproteobacteria bacterium]
MTVATVILLGVAATAAAQEGGSSSRTQAREHYEAGAAAFEASDYPTALRELEESYRLFPSLRTLYSIGLCQQALFDYPAALLSLREYLREGGEEIAPEVRVQVEAAIVEMARDMGRIEVVVDIAGAAVTIDGRTRGTTPLAEPVDVGPGEHAVEVRREGYRPIADHVSVAVGGSVVFRATMESEAPVAARLRIESGEVLGEAFVDGRSVGLTPVAVEVASGPHEVRVMAEGYGVGLRSVELAGGDDELVAFVLEPLAASGTGSGTLGEEGEVSATEDGASSLWWLWTAIGVVVVGGGLTAGVLLGMPEGIPAYDLRGRVP